MSASTNQTQETHQVFNLAHKLSRNLKKNKQRKEIRNICLHTFTIRETSISNPLKIILFTANCLVSNYPTGVYGTSSAPPFLSLLTCIFCVLFVLEKLSCPGLSVQKRVIALWNVLQDAYNTIRKKKSQVQKKKRKFTKFAHDTRTMCNHKTIAHGSGVKREHTHTPPAINLASTGWQKSIGSLTCMLVCMFTCMHVCMLTCKYVCIDSHVFTH